MKKNLIIPTLVIMALGASIVIAVDCGDTWQHNGSWTDRSTVCLNSTPNEKVTFRDTYPWTIFWTDTVVGRDVIVEAEGECVNTGPQSALACDPIDSVPHWQTNNVRVGYWEQVTQSRAFISAVLLIV